MAWLRRPGALLGALALALVVSLGNPDPPEARANIACDVGASPVGAVTGAIGIGNPVGDACDAITDPVLGVADGVLDPLKDAADSIGRGVFNQITTWATDGAVWLLGEVVELMNKTTSPDLLSKGFLRQYRQMAAIAVVLALLMLIFAVIESLGRGDAGMLLRVFLVHVPVAALATSAAYVVVQLLIATTDGFCEAIAHSTARDTRGFFQGAVKALAEAGAEAGAVGGAASGNGAAGAAATAAAGSVEVPLFVGFIAAIVAAFAAFLVWIELLMRDAAIYVVALFMPFAIAASIWPRWMGALRRTAELVVVIVSSKFVIVAIVALATSLLVNTGGKVEHVLAAGALLLLACFAPLMLFKLLPFAEGALSSAYNRQGAGGTAMRTASSSMQMMRHAAHANWAANDTKGGGAGGGGASHSSTKAKFAGAEGGGAGADGAAGEGGGAAGAVALPVAAGASAAKGSKAGAGRLAGSGTAQASAGSGDSAGETGANKSSPPPRPGQSASGEAPRASPARPSSQAEPAEAKGGKAPGMENKPPRPSAEGGAAGKPPGGGKA